LPSPARFRFVRQVPHMRALPAGLVVVILAQFARAAEPLDFRRDVQPILSNHCWNCHGQDDKSRKAGLRLDSFDAATRKGTEHDAALIPGKPDESPLLQRVRSADATEVMPPPSFKKPLSDSQKEILRRWIAEGGRFAKHWAFEPPQRPEIPKPKRDAKTPIDAFILARLEKDRLIPAPDADRPTWLRRVTFDLTGLPPTPEERAAFLADITPQAHEKVVDRLLASSAHAERMAMHWLDLARYADTNGYNNDEIRTMWPWRDWVIDAFARNLPYDQFLVEQLAGDQLPKPTLPQIVATGFNRNHVLTTEGGIIEEEYRAEYVADRVHTTSTVFMALSVQCARCHDHKYDPISQRDFYQLAAFFNNIPEGIVGYGKGIRMSEPLVKIPNAEQTARRGVLERRKAEVDAALAKRVAESTKAARQWANGLKPDEIEKLPSATLAAHFPFDDVTGKPVVNAVRPDVKTTLHGTSKHSPGKVGAAFDFDGKTRIEAGNIADFEGDQPFSIAVWIKPSAVANTAIVSKMAGDGSYRGYDLLIENGKLTTHVVHHWPDGGFKVASKNALKADVWQHVTLCYSGSRNSNDVEFYVDGKPWEHTILSAKAFTATIRTDAPFTVGSRVHTGNFTGSLDDLRVFSRLSPANRSRGSEKRSGPATRDRPSRPRSSNATTSKPLTPRPANSAKNLRRSRSNWPHSMRKSRRRW
jgi:Protein of unknown function (DUF1549)/Concanavalin A-like lectin/glucanases superfamily/Planctomycete cytochrome C